MKLFTALILFIFVFPLPVLAEGLSATDAGADMVAKGGNLFVRSLIDGMYNSTAINSNFGSIRGSLYTFITTVPDPYSIPQVKSIYSDYKNLAIYMVGLFIAGTWISRNIARTRITAGVFPKKDLSTENFIGGISMCFIALFANYMFMLALKITEIFSQIAMFNVMDSIAPNPDNLVLYAGMAVCDLTVSIFFIVRYFIIIAAAISCTVLAVLWVPESTRGFAKNTTIKIIRVLALQPAAIFAASIGIIGLKALNAAGAPGGYIGMTIFVFLVCYWFLFGNFEMIKKFGRSAIKVISV